jgi:hypothetical protein
MAAGTFFYVHGAGNRAVEAQANAVLLRDGLGISATPELLVPSTWGEAVGPDPDFPRVPDVLPESLHGIGEAVDEVAAADSYGPLKLLAAPQALDAQESTPTPSDIGWLLAALEGGTLDAASLGVTEASLRAAANEVAGSLELAAASGSDEQLVDAVLRSVAARALELDRAAAPPMEGLLGVDIGASILAVAGSVANHLVGALTSVVGWVGPSLKPGALLALSRLAAPQRLSLMTSRQFLTPTDVLFYQRRGAAVRAHIREELAGLDRPIVALGHSLGGIALVDTLFGPDAQAPADHGVGLLVTFGSQSAMLGAIGALDAVNPTIPWTNIWTMYDFVSFRASVLWPGATDVGIPMEIGFPDSHGAYYTTPAFFDAVRSAVNDVPGLGAPFGMH